MIHAMFKGRWGRLCRFWHKVEQPATSPAKRLRAISSQSKPIPSLRSGHLENAEDPEAAFLAESAIAWDAQKEALSNAKLRTMSTICSHVEEGSVVRKMKLLSHMFVPKTSCAIAPTSRLGSQPSRRYNRRKRLPRFLIADTSGVLSDFAQPRLEGGGSEQRLRIYVIQSFDPTGAGEYLTPSVSLAMRLQY